MLISWIDVGAEKLVYSDDVGGNIFYITTLTTFGQRFYRLSFQIYGDNHEYFWSVTFDNSSELTKNMFK